MPLFWFCSKLWENQRNHYYQPINSQRNSLKFSGCVATHPDQSFLKVWSANDYFSRSHGWRNGKNMGKTKFFTSKWSGRCQGDYYTFIASVSKIFWIFLCMFSNNVSMIHESFTGKFMFLCDWWEDKVETGLFPQVILGVVGSATTAAWWLKSTKLFRKICACSWIRWAWFMKVSQENSYFCGTGDGSKMKQGHYYRAMLVNPYEQWPWFNFDPPPVPEKLKKNSQTFMDDALDIG